MELELCSSGHEEICYLAASRSAKCPLCEANERIESLEDEIGRLNDQLSESEKE